MAPPTFLGNETVARGAETIGAVRNLKVCVCGVGALGANLLEHLARSGFENLKAIDRDRIEERNLATQPWQKGDVGQFKTKVIATSLYRAVGVDIDARALELTAENVSLAEGDVVVDCFDNATSRALLRGANVLHVGLAPGFGEVTWDERYRIPSDGLEDVCDVGLARALVMMTVACAGEALIAFALGKKRNFMITLADMKVTEVE